MEIDSETPPPRPAPSGPSADSSSNDPDPIVASYDVYTNPTLPAHRKLLILQHPNKQGPVRTAYAQVSEVRVKPRSGMLEVDVLLGHAHADYDRDKGLRWGVALQKSTAAKNGGSHGLAGGFGVGVPAIRGAGSAAAAAAAKRRGGAGPSDDFDRELGMLDWSEAVRQDKVLRTQTLGGQFPMESETNCRYMVGVFKGDQLHLTPATSLIHLRPQLHYLDAFTEQDRLGRPRDGAAGAAAAGKEAGAATTGSGGSSGAARAIHMSIKSAGAGNGELTTETMVDRLRVVQTEPWTNLKYEDDESAKAWDIFTSNLIYAGAPEAAEKGAPKDTGKDKGKGKEKAVVEVEEQQLPPPPQQLLRGQWRDDEFLRAVSGMRDSHGEVKPEGDDILEIKEEVPAEPVKPAVPRAKGKASAASAAAPKRGARGKSVAFKSTAMEID
ncbi:Sin-like protein conserved region-domain-containing protein [Xylariaceae sp. FL0662B]|nr:Sin-like protein conserved region-domain-containing protein [Xylariaceae sp. FL0662B]